MGKLKKESRFYLRLFSVCDIVKKLEFSFFECQISSGKEEPIERTVKSYGKISFGYDMCFFRQFL